MADVVIGMVPPIGELQVRHIGQKCANAQINGFPAFEFLLWHAGYADCHASEDMSDLGHTFSLDIKTLPLFDQ
ncbi:hypothetical protein SDC9_81449 [bioreactor metagenome]|uniref:Uncharacterized protein n=1 Tax=bioreactor metagenome TaxID=1076179 RepID=A0A644Z2T8_9ZZZZ